MSNDLTRRFQCLKTRQNYQIHRIYRNTIYFLFISNERLILIKILFLFFSSFKL